MTEAGAEELNPGSSRAFASMHVSKITFSSGPRCMEVAGTVSQGLAGLRE